MTKPGSKPDCKGSILDNQFYPRIPKTESHHMIDHVVEKHNNDNQSVAVINGRRTGIIPDP